MTRPSTVAVLVAVCASNALATSPLAPRPVPHTLDRLTRSAFAAGSQKSGDKVSSRLRAGEGWLGPIAGPLVPAAPPHSPDGKLRVSIDCAPLGDTQLAALEQAGVTIDGVELGRGRVRARLDAAALDRVAGFSWVRAVRPADRAVVRAGSVTTEGDAASRADLVRAQGLDGSGVVVGVISDGIDNLGDAQQSGDLPDVGVPGGCRRGIGNEGTALLEIVHDVAPGARLLFAGPADSGEMIEAVECLTAAGADVIVDDLGFFGEPYFEDGPVAGAVRAAVQAGVSYHSSAGNEAGQHLEQDFAGPNRSLHDFGGGDNSEAVVIPARGTLTCILQWNDPFGASANDYDLVLLDQDLNFITQSNDPQVGQQDPIEVVEVTNQSDGDAVANVLIDRFDGDARRLELFCLGASALEHATAAGSIVGHPALDEVVTVAAIDVADPGLDQVEPFSSRGPARVDFPARQDRAKPDVAGFDGVSISNAGGFPACPPACAFFGTSAASPHTAGVAALLLQKDPSLTPADVQAALRAGAVDIGVAGFDEASGFGRLDAVASVGTLGTSPQCNSDDECSDGDVCTVDVCDPTQGCVSSATAGAEGAACRIGQLASPDVCAPGELDARTATVIAKRVGSALGLLDKAAGASGGQRRKLLGKVIRQVGALRRRVSRADARGIVPDECASTVQGLIDAAQALVRTLAG